MVPRVCWSPWRLAGNATSTRKTRRFSKIIDLLRNAQSPRSHLMEMNMLFRITNRWNLDPSAIPIRHEFNRPTAIRRGNCFRFIVVSCTIICSLQAFPMNANPPPDDRPVAAEANDGAAHYIELIVPSHQGVISWRDVATAMADSLRLDPPTIQKMFPAGQIDLRSDGARLVLLGLDLALGDSVSLNLIRQDDGQPALRLQIDREALGLPAAPAWRAATVEIDDDWQQRVTGSPLDSRDLEALQQTLRELDQEGSLVRLIRPRIQPLLASFDELVAGKGDGAVAVARATIPGVHDIVTVDRSHGELLSPPTRDATQPVWQAILPRSEGY